MGWFWAKIEQNPKIRFWVFKNRWSRFLSFGLEIFGPEKSPKIMNLGVKLFFSQCLVNNYIFRPKLFGIYIIC